MDYYGLFDTFLLSRDQYHLQYLHYIIILYIVLQNYTCKGV